MFESSWGIATDSSGKIVVHDDTSSTDFDVANTEEFELDGSRDGFVTIFGNDGQTKNCSFVFGGESVEYGSAVSIDANDNVVITGKSKSLDYPVNNAYQDTKGDDYDFYISRFTAPLLTTSTTDTNTEPSQADPMMSFEVLLIGSIAISGAIVVIVIFVKKK